MSKPVVLIAEELSPATVEALGPDFEIRHCDGADRAELLPAIADVDAVLVRSATQIDAEALAAAEAAQGRRPRRRRPRQRRRPRRHPGRRHGGQRADVQHRQRRRARGRPAARLRPQHRAGQRRAQERRVEAHQVHRRRAGGQGRRRRRARPDRRARRAAAQRVRHELVAYDPYVQPARAAQMGIRLLPLDELLAVSDFITVHLPKTPETLGLIGDEALHKVKPTVRIINAARGGIVDEDALATALNEGRVAGAGIDVYAKEPCTDSPLFAFDQVVATPHLGASTDEAQEKAGIAVARSVRLALAGELVPDAVNVQGGAIAEDVRPALPLAEKLGRIFTALAGELAVRRRRSRYAARSPSTTSRCWSSPPSRACSPTSSRTRSPTSTPRCSRRSAASRSRWSPTSDSPDHRNLITVRGTLAGR